MLRSLSLALCLSLGASLGLAACKPAGPAQSARGQAACSALGKADIGGPFNLINQDGDAVTFETYLGKPQLIYFGFGYCPDVCPASLEKIGVAMDILGERQNDIQPMLFSIDPARDTPESLKLYLTAESFPKNLVALTGSQEQVDNAIKAYRIFAKRVDDPQSAAGYTMDHASLFYLMDAKGEFVDVLGHDTTPPDMAARIKKYLDTGC